MRHANLVIFAAFFAVLGLGHVLGFEVQRLAVWHLITHHRRALVLDPVIFGNVHHVRRGPVELNRIVILWPACRVIAPFRHIAVAGKAIQHPALGSVGLVHALGVKVEVDGRISVGNHLKPNALLFVLVVVFILILCAQAECAETA